MRGVYLASQVYSDSTIHTVITYDRGGIWSPVRKPAEVPCVDTGVGRFLHYGQTCTY